MEKYGINYEVVDKGGAFATLRVSLPMDAKIKAQSDAMVMMDSTLAVEGKLEGGIMGALGRAITGESLFFQTLHAKHGPGDVLLSSSTPGDLLMIEMNPGNPYYIQKGGFFAATEEIEISAKLQNLMKGLFSGEGFLVMEARGQGLLFVESFGAIHEVDIAAGDTLIVDNKHLVAWPRSVRLDFDKASSGWVSSLTSGEGIVCKITGPGKIYIQSHNPASFGSWISQMLPRKS